MRRSDHRLIPSFEEHRKKVVTPLAQERSVTGVREEEEEEKGLRKEGNRCVQQSNGRETIMSGTRG